MDLLDEITFYLPGWRLDRRTANPTLLGPERAKISVYIESKRYRFTGQTPKRFDNYGYGWNYYGYSAIEGRRTRANCSRDRSAISIARDLENRLIQHYLPMFKVAEEQIAAQKAALDELGHVEALTKRVLNAKNYRYRQNTEPRRELVFSSGQVEISNFDGGYMQFKIGRLSYEQGLKLAAYLSDNITAKS